MMVNWKKIKLVDMENTSRQMEEHRMGNGLIIICMSKVYNLGMNTIIIKIK